MIGLREISLILTATTILVLGTYVVSANPRRDINRFFGLLCISTSIWIFGIFLVRLSENKDQAMFWGKIPYFGVALGVGFFLCFTFVFPERSIPKWIPNPLLLISPGAGFALLSFTDLILKDVRLEPWGYDSVHGSLYGPYIMYTSSYTVAGIVNLFARFISASSPIRRLQLKYVLLGLTFAPAMALLTNAILPALWSSKFVDIGPTSFIVFIICSAYAIVKHRFMDIDFLIKKGSILLLTMIMICYPSFLIIIVFQNYFYGSIIYGFTILVLLLIVMNSLAFFKIRSVAEEKMEKFIFKDRYRNNRTLVDFGQALISILDLATLSRRVIDTLSDSMDVNNGSLYILDEEKASFELYEQKNLDNKQYITTRIPQDDDLFQWVSEKKAVPVKEELTLLSGTAGCNHILDRMTEMQAEVCIPLISRKKVIGIINLGKKQNGKPYTIQDIELLSTLANQTAIAIENAKLYEDLKKQKAIMRRADRLASLGTLTAGLAHEIRNPLVAIKTFIQLLPERLDDEEFRRDFLAIASGEADRISSLVNELLEFARPTEPQLQLENIREIMDGMVLLISTEVKNRNLEIVSRYEDNLPPIPVDREQIKQVFLNLLLNAIEATGEGGQVGVEIRIFSNKNGEKFLQVEIRDNGNGIPEEHLDHIFTPFFTTKDTGSGLGLAISHQIIQEHRGAISVESRLGEGSSFYINLPASLEQREGKGLVERDDQAVQAH
jgi:signal transduction histidine kinase